MKDDVQTSGPRPSRRSVLLNDAIEITSKDRNASYGDPEDNFQNIADIWNAQGFRFTRGVGSPRLLTPTDVALMMAGMKLARLKHNPVHRDSWLDLAGYAACGHDVSSRDVRNGDPKHD